MKAARVIGAGTFAVAIGAALTRDGWRLDAAGKDSAVLLIEGDSADAVAAIRAAASVASAVVAVVGASIAPVSRAALLATIGPLAAEHAPGVRLSAVDIGDGAAADDVAALTVFLADAESTTGQVVRIAAQ